jgi:hypothetical protein
MSQLNLTTEEDQLVLSGLRAKATQYAAMFGSEDQAILDLIAKVEGQLPTLVVESAPAPTAVVELEELIETPKTKKTKAVEE